MNPDSNKKIIQTGSLPLGKFFGRGEHWLWLTGACLSVALIMIVGLLFVIVSNGAGFFWPKDLTEFTLKDGESTQKVMGILMAHDTLREEIPGGKGIRLIPETQFRVGNRDIYAADFVWYRDENISGIMKPKLGVALERMEYGNFYGFMESFKINDDVIATGGQAWERLLKELPLVNRKRKAAEAIKEHEIGEISHEIKEATIQLNKLKRNTHPTAEQVSKIEEYNQFMVAKNEEFQTLKDKAQKILDEADDYSGVFKTADGREKVIPLLNIVEAWQPNNMSVFEKCIFYVRQVWGFIFDDPRESNQEGGVFPAIFGTVVMTVLMSLAVTPFGVLAAFYLREYASQGPFVRAVRIAINNLAGVPSIVFGVFGLGFFVYFVGGTMDQLFFSDYLPTPTFGTGGILWASLTLALLTVPVVIVATEESIAAVPRGAREGSLALGASKFQTICRVVLPASVPGILTGIILSMARGAGEVAPLMITGVVKLAPELPVDLTFPFFHLDRKFMHLGFHIFDVGFQSPNVEASKPMVYTTTLLLILIIIGLNIVAIRLRDKIRKKYQTGAFA